MEIHFFPHGLTVRELKELIKNWPEEYSNGEPTTVWIETSDGLSNQVAEVVPLNPFEGSADIIFERRK